MNDEIKEARIKYKPDNELFYQLTKKIVANEIANIEPQQNPTAIITVGQSGAGKSSITKKFSQQLQQQGGVVVVDVDRFRKTHPDFEEIQRVYGVKSSEVTTPFSAKIGHRVAEVATKNHLNIIYDQTSANPSSIKRLHEQLHHRLSPYQLELHVMAVAFEVSQVRIYGRYENAGGSGGGGRFVPKYYQQQSFDGVADSVKQAQDYKWVDRIVIYNKNGDVLYDSRLINGSWDNPQSAIDIFIAERNRELDNEEKSLLIEQWYKNIAKTKQRSSDTDDVDFVNELKNELAGLDKKGIEVKY